GAIAEQHARAADRQLEALAAEGLDQHAELQLSAAGDLENVIVPRQAQADGDVRLGLALQPIADHPALHLVAITAGIGAVVYREAHRKRRRIDLAGGNGHGRGGHGDGVGNGRLHQAGDGDDVAGFGALDGDAIQALEGEQLGGAAFLNEVAVDIYRLDRGVDLDPAALDPAG